MRLQFRMCCLSTASTEPCFSTLVLVEPEVQWGESNNSFWTFISRLDHKSTEKHWSITLTLQFSCTQFTAYLFVYYYFLPSRYIVTSEESWLDFRERQKICLFSNTSRRATGSTQSPTRLLAEALFRT